MDSQNQKVAADCAAALKEYCRGQRAKAKKTLQQITKDHAQHYLPYRYLARLLYHEAATIDTVEVNRQLAEQRLQLLKESLACSRTATELNPNSLSSAALRCTLVVNLLVEESSPLNGSTDSIISATPNVQRESCARIKQEFQDALAACNRSLSSSQPIVNDPVICITDGTSRTCDPCSLRVQDQVIEWIKQEKWDRVVAEKRNVLSCMQQVLESCYALLDSTKVPVEGVIRLLQHILRPQQQELQLWASQLLLGKGIGDLQKKVETQAAVAELLKILRPTQASAAQQQIPGQAQSAGPIVADPQPTQRARPSLPVFEVTSSEREWDFQQDANNTTRRKPKVKGTTKGAASQRKERTRYERYCDVEAFWKSLPPEGRRQLLRVPVATLLHGVRQEAGPDVLDDVLEGLVLLREQGHAAGARYWHCPLCDQRFPSGGEYLQHVELCHEELAVVDQQYVSCTKCQGEVVGMYYASTTTPNHNLCFRCYQIENNGNFVADGTTGWERVYPRSSAVKAWSDTSDFISTRDSFSSREEEQQQPGAELGLAGVSSDSWVSPAHKHCQHSAHSSPNPQLYFTPCSQPDHAARASGRVRRSSRSSCCSSSCGSSIRSNGLPELIDAEDEPHTQPPHGKGPGLAPATHPPKTPLVGLSAPHGSHQEDRGLAGPVTDASGSGPGADGKGLCDGRGGGGGSGLWKSWWPKRLMQPWGDNDKEKAGSGSGSGSGFGKAAQAPPTPPLQEARSPTPHQGSGMEALPPGASDLIRTSASSIHGSCPAAQQGGAPPGRSRSTSEPGQAPGSAMNLASGPGSRPGKEQARGQAGGLDPGSQQLPLVPGGSTALGQQSEDDGVDDEDEDDEEDDDEEGISIGSDVGSDLDYVGGLGGASALVDDVMRRLREMYRCDRELGDMSLGSITQFVYRKLSAAQQAGAAGAVPAVPPAMQPSLSEFLSQPSVVFAQPQSLRVVLSCLPLRDLQMVMAYVVRQHSDAVQHVDQGGSEELGSSSEELGGDSQPEEDALPPCLLQLAVHDEVAFDNLISQLWGRTDMVPSSLGAHPGAPLHPVHSYPPSNVPSHVLDQLLLIGYDSSMPGGAPPPSQQAAAHLSADAISPGGSVTSSPGVAPVSVPTCEAYLEVWPPWLEHLVVQGLEADGSDGPHHLRVLRWVYGNIVSTQVEECASRQRELRGGRDRDTVVLELLEDVGFSWRNLQAVSDKNNRLEELRRNVRAQFTLVKQLEEEGGHCTLDQAREFLDAIVHNYNPSGTGAAAPSTPATAPAADSATAPGTPLAAAGSSTSNDAGSGSSSSSSSTGAAASSLAVAPGPPGAKSPALYLCEQAAVDVVRRHPPLAQEASQRYARALLERELAVLALVEAQLAAEVEEAAREKGASEEALKKHRQEAREVESEYSRVAAEGPASHRRKDLLDKATKEAEHRERLQDLAGRLTALTEKIGAEEASRVKWADRLAEAEADLQDVRAALRQHAGRKASLEEVCAQLDMPLPAAEVVGGGDMEWRANRLECLMYRVLWVSEAVQMFSEQYSPHANSHHYQLFIAATNWAKSLAAEYDEQMKSWFAELDALRAKLRDAACVDLGYELVQYALELIRRRIEAASRRAQEQASLALLQELVKEAAVAKGKGAQASGGGKEGASTPAPSGTGAGGGKKKEKEKKNAKAKAADKQKEKGLQEKLAKQAEEEEQRRAAEEEKERLAAARMVREAAREAELERRRRELEELAEAREREAIRAAQEASLRERELQAAATAAAKQKAAAAGRVANAIASIPGAVGLTQSAAASDADLEAATRAAIEASLRDLGAAAAAGTSPGGSTGVSAVTSPTSQQAASRGGKLQGEKRNSKRNAPKPESPAAEVKHAANKPKTTPQPQLVSAAASAPAGPAGKAGTAVPPAPPPPPPLQQHANSLNARASPIAPAPVPAATAAATASPPPSAAAAVAAATAGICNLSSKANSKQRDKAHPIEGGLHPVQTAKHFPAAATVTSPRFDATNSAAFPPLAAAVQHPQQLSPPKQPHRKEQPQGVDALAHVSVGQGAPAQAAAPVQQSQVGLRPAAAVAPQVTSPGPGPAPQAPSQHSTPGPSPVKEPLPQAVHMSPLQHMQHMQQQGLPLHPHLNPHLAALEQHQQQLRMGLMPSGAPSGLGGGLHGFPGAFDMMHDPRGLLMASTAGLGGGPGELPEIRTGPPTPTFDPFAENPLLKALSADRTQPPPSVSSGLTTPSPSLLSPRSDHQAQLAAASLGSPMSGTVLQDADHIMSIMSILEPDMAGSTGKGGATKPAGLNRPDQQQGGRQGSGGLLGAAGLQGGGLGFGSSLASGPGPATSSAMPSLRGVAQSPGQQGQQGQVPGSAGRAGLGGLHLLPESGGGAGSPLLPSAVLPGLGQHPSRPSIWSTSNDASLHGGGGMSWGALPSASALGGRQQGQQAPQGPTSGPAPTSSAMSQADLVAALPATLLPSSLDPDSPAFTPSGGAAAATAAMLRNGPQQQPQQASSPARLAGRAGYGAPSLAGMGSGAPGVDASSAMLHMAGLATQLGMPGIQWQMQQGATQQLQMQGLAGFPQQMSQQQQVFGGPGLGLAAAQLGAALHSGAGVQQMGAGTGVKLGPGLFGMDGNVNWGATGANGAAPSSRPTTNTWNPYGSSANWSRPQR